MCWSLQDRLVDCACNSGPATASTWWRFAPRPEADPDEPAAKSRFAIGDRNLTTGAAVTPVAGDHHRRGTGAPRLLHHLERRIGTAVPATHDNDTC